MYFTVAPYILSFPKVLQIIRGGKCTVLANKNFSNSFPGLGCNTVRSGPGSKNIETGQDRAAKAAKIAKKFDTKPKVGKYAKIT
jgi:hypothetical protein